MLLYKPPVNRHSNALLLLEGLFIYLKLKGEGKDKIFIRAANRYIKYLTRIRNMKYVWKVRLSFLNYFF